MYGYMTINETVDAYR